MKLIHYTYVNSEYFREDEKISQQTARAELNNAQYNWLNKTGKCNVRPKADGVKVTIEKFKVVKEPKQKVLSDDKLFEKHGAEYKLSKEPYKGTMKWGVSRHNKKYGYWNFVTYLESEEDYKQAVIDDIKNQENIAKQKKQPKEIIDDDI